MRQLVLVLSLQLITSLTSTACSILYFIDKTTGKIYAVNNEDYWYNVKPYIKIMPPNKSELGRLWYGWDDFAQGGINQSGLFFDGAVTPNQSTPKGCNKPKGNLGDEILAKCKTVEDALTFLSAKDICLSNGHLLFGDKSGNAAVIEWVKGEKKVIRIANNYLMATNFLLSDTAAGNYPCKRYDAMEAEIKRLTETSTPLTLKEVGNIAAKAVQPKTVTEKRKEAGTLYSTFINISDMEFVLVYKLDNKRITRMNLRETFKLNKAQTIILE
ncbi:carcinine hydrolase/isopenicillin-N N-acyltransferase family protein [Solitalea canadensis]|nr:carcinine hydrolase/isopenicillin-N N-acyltransferase family protein [Solitalea canadensis]